MKYFVASDIHGSATFCQRMLDAYFKEGADRLILLGDILYHGPRNDLPEGYAPKQVISMLNDVKSELFCVRGNCDTEVDQMVLDFPILADYALIPLGKRTVFVTHGHRYNTDSPPPMKQGDILLHGHTHVPACTDFGGCLYVNPGSVSIPKEDSWHGYMIIEENRLVWKDLESEVKKIFEL